MRSLIFEMREGGQRTGPASNARALRPPLSDANATLDDDGDEGAPPPAKRPEWCGSEGACSCSCSACFCASYC